MSMLFNPTTIVLNYLEQGMNEEEITAILLENYCELSVIQEAISQANLKLNSFDAYRNDFYKTHRT